MQKCFPKIHYQPIIENHSKILRELQRRSNLILSRIISKTIISFFLSLSELTDCIMKSHNTAVGPDQIHYEFIKQLPSSYLDFLLQAFNEVWVSGKFPTSWKQATIIPMPKPGKDNADQSNYRPITLTSCLCKTLKCMINTRLIWFLESNCLITNFQSIYKID